MDYEFQRNTLTGTLVADFSQGQEVLGFWFVEELGECSEKYDAINQVIAKLQSNELKNWHMVGKSLSIELDGEQVRVFANDLENSDDIEFEEALSLYNDESEAFCGLEDFHVALQSWHAFIDEGY